jgi:small subunit ribosomal protein S7
MADANTTDKDRQVNAVTADNAVAAKGKRTKSVQNTSASTNANTNVNAQNSDNAQAQAQPKPKRSRKADAVAEEQLLFGKYSFSGITIADQSFSNYLNLIPMKYPNIYGRRKQQAYYFSHANVIERLMNKLMRGGTGKKVSGKVIRTAGKLQGKKIKVMHIIEQAFDTINKQTGKNPIQLLVDAIQNSAPIEDTTRVRYGGINYNVAVDVSSLRRLNIALKNLALAAIMGSFKNRKSIADALANEIMLAANKSSESYAIKKKIDAERMARSAR